MLEHIIIFIRSVSAFFLLLLVTRILGKQTISNMTFHDFVTAVILGAIAANLAFNEKINTAHLLISLGVFTVTSYLILHVALKSRKLRKWISGAPTVLIEKGKVLEENMKLRKISNSHWN